MKKLLIVAAIVSVLLLSLHGFYSFRNYNVLLITADTLRSDHLSSYNPKAPKTPNFDRLAAEGVLFEQAYTTIPITLPAHTAILTSHAPHSLGLFNNGETYDGRYPLISELVAEKGYRTAAFVSLGVLKGEFGFGSSFQEYNDSFDDTPGRYYKTAEELNAKVLPWLDKNHAKPFFAWVHYSDPHEPYVTVDAPPDTEVLIDGVPATQLCLARKEKIELKFVATEKPTRITFRAIARPGPRKIQQAESKRYIDKRIVTIPESTVSFGSEWLDIRLSTGQDARYFDGDASLTVASPIPGPASISFSGGVWGQRIEEVRKNYEAEVQYLDSQLGVLLQRLESLDLMKNTIIVLTADHGEGLKTHGYLGHVGNLHNEVVHVPLLFYFPNLGRKNTRIKELVNHLDITPTLLDLLRVRNPRPMEGGSLKRFVSFSPLDQFFSQGVKRKRVFVESYSPEAPSNVFAMVEGTKKLIFQPPWKWEIYDTSTDAIEKKNIARIDAAKFQSEEFARLRKQVEDFSTEAERTHTQRKNPQLDESQQEMLHTLGYVNQGQQK